MKELSLDELHNAPGLVLYIWACASMNQPIGMSTFEKAISEFPEYFPDEVEHRRKWDSIPQSVHDKYYEECRLMEAEVFKNVPPSQGLIAMINNTEEYQRRHKAWTEAEKVAKPLRKKIHEKYYSSYGIAWNGF